MENNQRYDSDQKFFNSDISRFTAALMYLVAVIVISLMIFSILAICRISSYAFRTYDSVDSMPYHRVGLLLGTSPMRAPGVPNGYFTARIDAASKLYHAHKIDYILASGDNRALSYNEPREMRRALIKKGVPPERIVLDYAGIRTLDSVKRAAAVFMLKDMTVISQGFHNERALFIADADGIIADGFNAKEPDDTFAYLKVRFREFFARIRCVLDVYLLDTGPHFYGEPVKIGNIALPVPLTNKPVMRTSKEKKPGDNAKILSQKVEHEALAETREQEIRGSKAEQMRLAIQQTPNSAGLSDDSSEVNDKGQCDTEQDMTRPDCQGFAQSGDVSKSAQDEAQKEAASIAARSLNEGENTYIDPDFDNGAKLRGKKQSSSSELQHKKFGDPWD